MLSSETHAPNGGASPRDPDDSDRISTGSNKLEAFIVADGGLADPLEELSEPSDPTPVSSSKRQLSDRDDLEKGLQSTDSDEVRGVDDEDDDDVATANSLEQSRRPSTQSMGAVAVPPPSSADPNLVTWDAPDDPCVYILHPMFSNSSSSSLRLCLLYPLLMRSSCFYVYFYTIGRIQRIGRSGRNGA